MPALKVQPGDLIRRIKGSYISGTWKVGDLALVRHVQQHDEDHPTTLIHLRQRRDISWSSIADMHWEKVDADA